MINKALPTKRKAELILIGSALACGAALGPSVHAAARRTTLPDAERSFLQKQLTQSAPGLNTSAEGKAH